MAAKHSFEAAAKRIQGIRGFSSRRYFYWRNKILYGASILRDKRAQS